MTTNTNNIYTNTTILLQTTTVTMLIQHTNNNIDTTNNIITLPPLISILLIITYHSYDIRVHMFLICACSFFIPYIFHRTFLSSTFTFSITQLILDSSTDCQIDVGYF